ncbi:hypothetical protein A2U01_0106141, partial [Trifolium medium]|nr:hypothetical protein [Trifolium medium]
WLKMDLSKTYAIFVAGIHFWACVAERVDPSLRELVASARQGSPVTLF